MSKTLPTTAPAPDSPDDYNYPFHPIAAIFPLLEGDELNALAADIKDNGLREPCWLYEGKILDGRNRKTACTLAGVDPTFREFTGDRLAAIRFVWSMNRRATPEQRSGRNRGSQTKPVKRGICGRSREDQGSTTQRRPT